MQKEMKGNRMTLLFITYIDFNKADSGSKVRPQKMYKAFLDLGIDVKLLVGHQSENKDEREKNVDEINKWLNNNRPDFCYIESSTNPIRHKFDIMLLRRIYKMGIPSAYFVRDIYYKFKSSYSNTVKVSIAKRLFKYYLQKRTERTLKAFDIVYFPTMSMANYYNYSNMKPLPPAGENKLRIGSHDISNTCIYVGGLSEGYGFEMLIKAFDMLNSYKESLYKLIIICRKEEYLKYCNTFIDKEWIEVYHVTGDDIEPYYRKADIALIPKKKELYNDITISVKMFEYMSYGLPIVSVSATESDKYFSKYDIGLVTEDSPVAFSNAIKRILSDHTQYEVYRNNVTKALLSENLWINRAMKVKEDLVKCL